MPKGNKIARLQGSPPFSARGRTVQATARVRADPIRSAAGRERRVDSNRPTSVGGGKIRGDRRDTSKTYTTNVKHKARGNTARADVKTRKR